MRWETYATRSQPKNARSIRTEQKEVGLPKLTEREQRIGNDLWIHRPRNFESFGKGRLAIRLACGVTLGIYRKPMRPLGKQRAILGAITEKLFGSATKPHLKLERSVFQ